MASNVSGGSQNRIMVDVKAMEGTKETKPGVFSQLKTWMKTRLYGSALGGLLVRYGARKAMAAVKKHATAVKLLKEMELDISTSSKLSTEKPSHDQALVVVGAQLKQAEENLDKAVEVLNSKEADFNLLRSKDKETKKNMKAMDKIEISRKNLKDTSISRHGLETLRKEIRATIKKEWDPGLFTRSATRKEMASVRDIILKSLESSSNALQLLKKTKREKSLESKSSSGRELKKPSVPLGNDFRLTVHKGHVDNESIE